MINLNVRIGVILAEAENAIPGIRGHAERVAVYSVAVGHRLGIDAPTLLRIRITAELQVIEVSDSDLVDLFADDPIILEIVALCAEFDRRRFGFKHPQMTDSECVTWLDTEARSLYVDKTVDALLAVQSVIQPIGT